MRDADASKKGDPSGKRNGGGQLGRCPIVLEDTALTAKDVPGGGEITVKPARPADVAALLEEAKERAEAFSPGAPAKEQPVAPIASPGGGYSLGPSL